jgi:hypothetical protein
MIVLADLVARRRYKSNRRLLFLWLTLMLALPWVVAAAAAQDAAGARIVQRQARLLRGGPDYYRVIEVLRVRLAGADTGEHVLAEPLPLVLLPERAGRVMGVGGDVSPSQLIFDPPGVSLLGSVGSGTFEIAFAYTLPGDERGTAFTGQLPVDAFLLEVDRATVDARPGPSLQPGEVGGSESRPLQRYEAAALAAGATVTLRLVAERVGWRQRVAVLIAGWLAAAAVGVAVWRRRDPVAPATG